MAKRKEAEKFDVDEDELLNMFDDDSSQPKKLVRTPAAASVSPPPNKRAMTPAEAWDAIEEKNAALTKSQTPISELDRVPSMDDIIEMPLHKGGTRKMRRTGKARKMKTKKSSKSRTRKSIRRRHKNKRTH